MKNIFWKLTSLRVPNVRIVFTRWRQDEKAFKEREISQIDEKFIKKKISKEISSLLLNHQLESLEFAFIDNIYYNPQIRQI